MHLPFHLPVSHHISRRIFCALLLFVFSFFAGSAVGKAAHIISTRTASPAIHNSISGSDKNSVTSQSRSILAESANWGLSFQKEGERPVGNATIEELRPYDAWYAADTTDPVIYLTFDCGYENGNTEAILDALEKHQVSATFFVTGTFINGQADLIRRMAAQGHTVGNHTLSHPDMSQIATIEDFQKELDGVSSVYEEITGEPMTKFYRPPRGVYSTSNLAMAKELGYHTFFWSLAYVDWLQDAQPTKEEAYKKLLTRIHPGAIVLLHSTSSTNAAILDELLTKWEEMGYHFDTLNNLVTPDAP